MQCIHWYRSVGNKINSLGQTYTPLEAPRAEGLFFAGGCSWVREVSEWTPVCAEGAVAAARMRAASTDPSQVGVELVRVACFFSPLAHFSLWVHSRI